MGPGLRRPECASNPRVRGEVVDGLSLTIAPGRIAAALQQQRHNLRMPALRCDHQRRTPTVVRQVRISAAIQQQLHGCYSIGDRRVIRMSRGPSKRGQIMPVALIDRHADRKQRVNDRRKSSCRRIASIGALPVRSTVCGEAPKFKSRSKVPLSPLKAAADRGVTPF